MVTDPSWRNFLNYEIGHERSWPVVFDLAPVADKLGSWPAPGEGGIRRIYQRWSRVCDGPRLTVEVYPSGKDALLLPLDFARVSAAREVRDWLRHTPRPFLQRFEGQVRPD